MASYSTNLLLSLLANGESGVHGFADWGAATNSNIQFLEDTVTETSDITVNTGDVTLSAAEERSLYLNLSGTLTGNRSVLTNDRKGMWLVYNGCTLSGNTLTFKTTSGTGATMAAGEYALFVCDGTNAIKVLSNQLDTRGSIASATTTNIGAKNEFILDVSGTTTITAFDSVTAGINRVLIFADALTLTHNGTSLILPGAANITTAAGDAAWMVSEGSGNWRCLHYLKAASPPYELLDEDTMSSDSAVKAASQQSIKAYVDGATQGKYTVGVAAGGLAPTTTAGCASSAQAETTTNAINYTYLAFDASTEEHAFFWMPTPKSYNASTVTMRAAWTHPSTATNFDVVWEFEVLAVADGDALDTAVGTAVTVTDTGGTTQDFYTSAESAAITPSGTAAKQDWFYVQVSRKAADGSDTLAVDAHLIGVELYYTTDAGTDD